MQGLNSRIAAARLLGKVLREQAGLEDAFEAECRDGLLAKEDARDRAFARAILTTALRRKGFLDEALKKFIRKALPASSSANEILHIAATQMLFMRVPARAAISLAVESAKRDSKAKGFANLINAVLHRLEAEAEKIMGPKPKPGIDAPRWLFARWQRNAGTETARAIAAANLEEAPLDLSVKADAAEWAARLGAEILPNGTLRLNDAQGRVDELPGFEQGAWWVQDQAASLPARLLGNVSGKRVLDLCAAPGGKTAQLAAAGGLVTALDDSAARLERLKGNLARLGLAVETVCADARDYAPQGLFDAILLDAPCSATGTLRRHPDIAWHRSDVQIRELAILQRDMLAHAAGLLAPGGQLVFATCSLEKEEGEDHLDHIPEGLELDPIRPEELPDPRLWKAPGAMRSLPQFGMDGFFAARFRKRGLANP